MKTLLFLILLTPTLYAKTSCRGYGNLNFYLDDKAKTFTFNQFCWNPCNMGDGLITQGPSIGWAGIRYSLDLTHSSELIAPLESPRMFLLLDYDRKTGSLRAGDKTIELTCEEREDI